MRPITLLPLVLLATACAQASEPLTCDATALSGFTGTRISNLPPTEAPSVRVIRPGDVVTMDFQPQRLNLEVDNRDRLERAYCG